jgi:hypothetical protein
VGPDEHLEPSVEDEERLGGGPVVVRRRSGGPGGQGGAAGVERAAGRGGLGQQRHPRRADLQRLGVDGAGQGGIGDGHGRLLSSGDGRVAGPGV